MLLRALFFLLLTSTVYGQADWRYWRGVPRQHFLPEAIAVAGDGTRYAYAVGSDTSGVFTPMLFAATAEGEWLNQYPVESGGTFGNGFLLSEQRGGSVYALIKQGGNPQYYQRYEVTPTDLDYRSDVRFPTELVREFHVESFTIFPGAPLRYLVSGTGRKDNFSTTDAYVFLFDENDEVVWSRHFPTVGPLISQLEIFALRDTSTAALVMRRGGTEEILIELDLTNGSTLRDAVLSSPTPLLELHDLRYHQERLYAAGSRTGADELSVAFVADVTERTFLNEENTFHLTGLAGALHLNSGEDAAQLHVLTTQEDDDPDAAPVVVTLEADPSGELSIVAETEVPNPVSWVHHPGSAGRFFFLYPPHDTDTGGNRLQLFAFDVESGQQERTEFFNANPYSQDEFVGIARHERGYVLAGYRGDATHQRRGWLQLIDPTGSWTLEDRLSDFEGYEHYGPLLRTAKGGYWLQRYHGEPFGTGTLTFRRLDNNLTTLREVSLPAADGDFATGVERADGSFLWVNRTMRMVLADDATLQSAPHEVPASAGDFTTYQALLNDDGSYWLLRIPDLENDFLFYQLLGFDAAGRLTFQDEFPLDDRSRAVGSGSLGDGVTFLMQSTIDYSLTLHRHDSQGNALALQNAPDLSDLRNRDRSGRGTLIPYRSGVFDPYHGLFFDRSGTLFHLSMPRLRDVLPIAYETLVGVGRRLDDALAVQFRMEFSLRSDQPNFNFDLQIYPNPNPGIFGMRISDHWSDYRIVDVHGRVWREGPARSMVFAPELPDGVYFLQLGSGRGKNKFDHTQRFVVRH